MMLIFPLLVCIIVVTKWFAPLCPPHFVFIRRLVLRKDYRQSKVVFILDQIRDALMRNVKHIDICLDAAIL